MRLGGLVLLLLAASAARAQPQEVIIYRCTDALGRLTIQNGTPCPEGSKQKTQAVEKPMVIPAYEPPPMLSEPEPPPVLEAKSETVAPERPRIPEPAVIADTERLPPPPIFQCDTWENKHYLSEDPEPKPRCVRLQTTGLNGDPNAGAGQACEMKYDLCSRVPDVDACDAWKQRQREIESTWRFAAAADRQPLQDEFARVTKILTDTTCGKQ